MLKRFLIAAVCLLAACQPAAPTETRTATPETTRQWLETEMNGVSLGLWTPEGWEADLSDGLVLAEHSVSSRGKYEDGILIYCFVPPMDEFQVSASDANYAWAVLKQVVKMPSHTGIDVSVSEPTGFDWETFPAAYYLLTTGDGVRALVLALGLPNPKKLVVCNVSVPMAQADRIRQLLPNVLDGFVVDGTTLHGAALDVLPDPLPFPRYSLAATAVDSRVAAGSGQP